MRSGEGSQSKGSKTEPEGLAGAPIAEREKESGAAKRRGAGRPKSGDGKFCIYCGAKIPGAARFCIVCGRPQ